MTPPTVHPFLMNLLRCTDGATSVPPPPHTTEWETIVEDAAQQGLISFLRKWCSDAPADQQPPAPLLDRVKASAVRTAAKNLLLGQELAAILLACTARNLACVPIRGLALAQQLYGELSTRPLGDIDLLVRRESLPDIADLLTALGFSEMDRRPGFARTYSNTLEFVKKRHGWVLVEPHWTIAYPPFADRIDMEAVFLRCVRGHVLGVESRLLGREDLLLHLCFHLIHRKDDAPMLWFYELDRLIRQAGLSLDWSQMVGVASKAGQDLFLLEALRQVNCLFRTPIPERVLAGPATTAVMDSVRSGGHTIEHRVLELLAGSSNADGRESLALFFALTGFRTKVRYAAALLVPSSEFMRLHYGLSSRWQVGVHYLTRIMYVVWEGLKGLGGLLFGAGGGDRTRTGRLAHGILSPGRLPIPPPRQTPPV
jgi:hypothetical protein